MYSMQRAFFTTLLQRFACSLAMVMIVSGFFLVLPQTTHAQLDDLETVNASAGLASQSLPVLIGTIIRSFLAVLGVVLLVLVIYAGFLWMTSNGNGEQVEKAKKILINAVVGLIIILASYAITTFIVNALTGALGGSGSSSSSSSDSSVSVERLSGSLGSGGILDHYPDRNATDVPRNANIMVTFKSAMNPESFIDGYDDNGTPDDTSDDTVATDLNTDNVLIYRTEEGESDALDASDVAVTFTEDQKTFVFNPNDYLGSASGDVSYTVFIDDAVEDKDGDAVVNNDGYEWSFEVGTEIDLTAPYVVRVSPAEDEEHDRNIVVQITFSEAMDPTTVSGVREAASGFSNIQTQGDDESAPTAGTYEISNEYKTVTFTSTDACGTNSCAETIYCLPGGQTITVTAVAATVSDDDPQAETPYDGIVDASGNALDADDDGEAGDDYSWSFDTTNDINLDAPEIRSIAPDVLEEDVDLDQDVVVTFDSVMMSSTLSSSVMTLATNPVHEIWYKWTSKELDSSGNEVTSSSQTAVQTQVTMSHGVFLESSEDELTGDSCTDASDCGSGESCNSDGLCVEEGTSYLYAIDIADGVKNEYQNCYVPAEGPDGSGGSCNTSTSQPYCCNGSPSSTECGYF